MLYRHFDNDFLGYAFHHTAVDALPSRHRCGRIPSHSWRKKNSSEHTCSVKWGEYSSLSRADGSFTFYNVDAGIYLLEVLCVEFAFPQIKVKIVKGEEYDGGDEETRV